MNRTQKLIAIGIIVIVVLVVLFKFLMHSQRRNLYDQAKQFDEDVRRGRYTPVEMPDGKVRYEKHW